MKVRARLGLGLTCTLYFLAFLAPAIQHLYHQSVSYRFLPDVILSLRVFSTCEYLISPFFLPILRHKVSVVPMLAIVELALLHCIDQTIFYGLPLLQHLLPAMCASVAHTHDGIAN